MRTMAAASVQPATAEGPHDMDTCTAPPPALKSEEGREDADMMDAEGGVVGADVRCGASQPQQQEQLQQELVALRQRVAALKQVRDANVSVGLHEGVAGCLPQCPARLHPSPHQVLAQTDSLAEHRHVIWLNSNT